MRILDAGKSYGQLGYVTARIMHLRDRLAKGDIPTDAAEKAQETFDTLHEIGDGPEAWKFAAIVQRVLGPSVLSDRAKTLAAEARRRCQYTPLMRLLHRLAG